MSVFPGDDSDYALLVDAADDDELDAIGAAMAIHPSGETMPAAARNGMRYLCTRCDVWGTVKPGEKVVCWVCDGDDTLTPR